MREIQIKGINETVYHHVCDNGLNLYMWVNKRVESVYMSLLVKYGSVHTEFISKGKKIVVPDGSAHFLEHVKFNESDDYTAHDFYYKTGADINAFTTFDYTSYYVVAMSEINKNLLHLLDYVQNPFFTKPLIEKEKGIIVEEGKMGEDNPETINYFGIFKNLFNNCKYKNLITGTTEDIRSTTVEDMENIFFNFYHPENMALFVTGNINPEEIKMIVDDNQNKKDFWKYKNPKVVVPKEKLKVREKKTVINGNVVEPRVRIGVKIPRDIFSKYNDFDIRLAINLILNINFGSTSDLKDKLLENNLATHLSASSDIYDEYVIIVVSAETKYPEEVSKVIKDKLNNLEIDKTTFDRKVKGLIATFILNYDSVERVNAFLQDDYVNYGKIIDNAKEKYEKLTLKKTKSIIELLEFDNISEYVMKPNK